MPFKLYVGNLPQKISAEDLRTLFSEYGKVLQADHLPDRGIGFIVSRKIRSFFLRFSPQFLPYLRLVCGHFTSKQQAGDQASTSVISMGDVCLYVYMHSLKDVITFWRLMRCDAD